MSLYSSMQTAVSGMTAQSNKLSSISDNIANASTTGYKKASAQFETLLGTEATSGYESGGVITDIRYGITDQGTITSTTSATDLAINGNGFFVVSKNGEGSFMTRAGSFLPDANGNLVNSAGFELMGYKAGPNGISSTLSVVNVASTTLQAAASTKGALIANLPSTASAVAAAALPSTNAAGAAYTAKTSMTFYDNLGKPIVADVYLTKTGNNTWEATAYNQADASSTGNFPYASAALGTINLTFDSTTGRLTATSATSLSLTIPNGKSVSVDLSSMTQLATTFGVTTASADGNSPSRLARIAIDKDGTLTEVFASGAQVSLYKIPLAMVNSPNKLTPISGNVYEANLGSGAIVISQATTNGTGSILSDSLEQSTVDLATELTNMIQAQRGYEANSKVLQSSSDLLGVLNRITTN